MTTGSVKRRINGEMHEASITLTAEPHDGVSVVCFSGEVLESLKELFGAEVEYGCECIRSGIIVQISCVNVAGEMPQAGRTSFHVEVIGLHLKSTFAKQETACLLLMAGMNAMGDFLEAFEEGRSAA